MLKWESIRENPNPRLVKFIGRPKDLSPRARFYSTLWLRNEPFDRHDWYVDRGDGNGERRYVIDFYNGQEKEGGNGLPSMYLDVRPALDDVESGKDRMKMFFRDAFPGIAGLMVGGRSSSSSSSSGSGSTSTNGATSMSDNSGTTSR